MSGIKDQKNIEELRKRLYERGAPADLATRHSLTPETITVSRGWDAVTKTPALATAIPEANAAASTETVFSEQELTSLVVPAPNKKRRYRTIIIIISLLFFIITVAASSVYLFFGNNQISANNISLNVEAPFSIPGGEILPLQISIANQNDVAIEAASIIINYPAGTRSVDEDGRELYEERIKVDAILAGQAINIPARAVLFGEENETKEIKVSVEYRITGSNGNFFKEATPIQVQISSSPLVLQVRGLEKISSGQEMEVRLLLRSNAAAVQKNILVTADFPETFSYISAEPDPAYGKNTWLIEEIKPESSTEIVLRGLVTGLSSQTSDIKVQAGNAEASNQFIMDSVLAQGKFSYNIEQPFTGVVVEINGDRDGAVVLEPGQLAEVSVTVTNTLAEPIYDMRVELTPRGNLIRDDRLVINRGFYDTNTKSIRFDVSGSPELAEVKPGDKREFTFNVKPDSKQKTASFDVSANVFARRVNDGNVAEALVGSGLAEVKYSADIMLGAQVGYSDGVFTDNGPVPPVADLETTYTITLVAEAGVNDMASAVLTTNFPQYITWKNQTSGDGQIEFNPVSKQLKWTIGDITAGTKKSTQVQIGLLSSVTQVGQTPVIVGLQDLRAIDRFTGVTLREQNRQLTNELSTELGFVVGNGMIQPKQ
jgi:hypothetical protein